MNASRACLLDALGVRQADVLGYSQGGAVAQQFARAYPGRVRRLVLVGTYAYNTLTPQERLEGWLTPDSSAWVRSRSQSSSNSWRRTVAAYRALLAFDSRGWLREIAAPTLVVCGAADTAVPRRHAELRVVPGPNTSSSGPILPS
jgi:pimeloyl-ACP methyl ester carboxylesterase